MRVLVTAASRHGATRDIGSRIVAELRSGGHDADLVDPQDVSSLDGYDAVVLGSAIYVARWLPAAREFARRFAADLAERPVWLFSSGLAMSPAAAANSPAETRALIAAVRARGHRAFGGLLDRSVLSFAERAIVAAARGKEGDHRDLAAVTQWAGIIADELARTAAPA